MHCNTESGFAQLIVELFIGGDNKTKAKHNMCWTTLYATKHKERK